MEVMKEITRHLRKGAFGMKKVDMRPVADAVNAYVNGQISEQEFRLLMTAACLSDPDAPMEQEPEAPSLD